MLVGRNVFGRWWTFWPFLYRGADVIRNPRSVVVTSAFSAEQDSLDFTGRDEIVEVEWVGLTLR